jgi:acetoin utilization protein AcuB
VTPDATVARVRELMNQKRTRSMPVLRDGRVVDVMTDRDITTLDVTLETLVALLMTRDAVSVSPRTSIQEAARLLLECEVDGPAGDRRWPIGRDHPIFFR